MAESGNEALAHKGRVFLDALSKNLQSNTGKTAIASTKIVAENLKFVGFTALNPKGQIVVISAVAVRKAMHAAGLATKDETMQCLITLSKLGSTLALGAVAAPATLGASALLAIGVAALEGYQVGTACFTNGGAVTHAVEVQVP